MHPFRVERKNCHPNSGRRSRWVVVPEGILISPAKFGRRLREVVLLRCGWMVLGVEDNAYSEQGLFLAVRVGLDVGMAQDKSGRKVGGDEGHVLMAAGCLGCGQ